MVTVTPPVHLVLAPPLLSAKDVKDCLLLITAQKPAKGVLISFTELEIYASHVQPDVEHAN